MVQVPDVKESFPATVHKLVIGATADEGGTRSHSITVGGAKVTPWAHFDGDTGAKPVCALEIQNRDPVDWPEKVREPWKDVLNDPVAWAKKCVEEHGAGLLCVKLAGCDPDNENIGPDEAATTVKSILDAVKVPLIVLGCGKFDKDNAVFEKVSQIGKGEKMLLGFAEAENYKKLVALCQADGHSLVALAPLDIALGKQLAQEVANLEFPMDRVASFQTTGALGYGLEYTYSIQERQRLAALGGDKMMMTAVLATVGHEAWRAKEARIPESEVPELGKEEIRGPMWEAMTGTALLLAGTDILICRHPEAFKGLKSFIDKVQG
ncbi:MAG: acetyl-CoA decarbonylase/synthase complex subunit delta [Planctomycetota bacterium]|jgi:acetyl-CoA decarbonylase/synthase complex subunit delta